MPQQTINVGTAPNDGTGTPLRTAFQYTNSNFSELYTAVGPNGNNIVVPGNATITGDLTVRTNKLYVTATGVGCGMTPITPLSVSGAGGIILFRTTDPSAPVASPYVIAPVSTGFSSTSPVYGYWYQSSGIGNPAVDTVSVITSSSERYRIAADGVATWSNVGGVAGTAMTLNSTGLGVGGSPTEKLSVNGSLGLQNGGTQRWHISATSGSDLVFTRSTVADRFTITSDGNVGIGVTPSAWSGTGVKVLDVGAAGSFAGSAADVGVVGNAYYNGSSWIYKTSFFSGRYAYALGTGQHQWFTAASGTAGNAITFTQAMTLTAAGELLVGTTSAGGVFDTKFFLSTNSGTNKWAVGPYAATPTNFAIIPTPGTGGVYLSGTSATSWTAYSDERLKDIIEPITNALTKVGSLRAIIGKFKGDEANTRRPFLIAQDLQSALPEAVDASNPDRLGVSYTYVIPLLVAAIKELTARVQTLETR